MSPGCRVASPPAIRVNAIRADSMALSIRPVRSKADKKKFVDVAFRLNGANPHWVPPLKAEVMELLTPGKNPWFEHGEA